MRLSTVTACTLGILSVAEWSQKATATAPLPVSTAPQDVVVPTQPPTVKSVRAIAAPERISTLSFATRSTQSTAIAPAIRTPTASKTVQTVAQSTAQYYQNYQSTEPQQAIPQAAQSTEVTPQAAQPDWIVPNRTSIQPTAQTPRTTQPRQTPAPARTPNAPNPNLVLTATEVQILGADAELQQFVRSTIRTQPGSNVSQTQLDQDVTSILETGLFSNASVSSRTNPNGLSVTFQVQPAIVRSLSLVNAQALTPAIANQFFSSQIGRTVSPNAINQSIRQVNDWYRQNGYNLARVVAVTPNREGVLTIEVAEGTVSAIQFRFVDEQGRPTNDKGQPVRGRTRESFLRSQVQLKPGQLFQASVANQDLQRILQTGLFTSGRVTLEGDARQTIVVYNLNESRSRAFNFGGGYNDDLGLNATVNYSDTNVGGIGQQLSTNVTAGLRDVQFDGRFVSPYRATEPDKLGYSTNVFRRRGLSRVFTDEVKLLNGDRVREGRFGGGVAVNRPIGNGWDGSLGLNYTRVSLRDSSGNVVRRDRLGNPLSFSGTGIDDLTTLNFIATRDQRDNPISPTRGSILTLSTGQSVPIGRGNILSNQLQANYSEYIPVNIFNFEKTQKQPEVFAYNVQVGTTLGDLPPYNAFTLGGVNSVRGYDTSDVAISRSYLLASAEYRFPIYNIVGGAVFADLGTDLGSSKSVLGQPGIVRDRPGAGFGIGIGLRVQSPFGIIRAGYGINDQGVGRFQVGFGEKF